MYGQLADSKNVSTSRKDGCRRLLVVILVLFLSICLRAGSRNITQFAVYESSENIIASDSVTLDVSKWLMVKIYGDAAPGGVGAYAGAVTNLGYNNFRIYWAAPGEVLNEVRYRDLTLLETGFNDGTPTTVFDLGRPDITYLHAASGAQGSVCTFVDLNAAGTLWAVNGPGANNRYSVIDGSTPYHSLCRFEADTFLVAHRVGNSTILLRKILSLPAGFIDIDSDTVASDGTNENSYRNTSVAVDSVGRILVTYTRGGVNPPNDRKDLYYALYRRDLVKLRSGIIDSGVSVSNEYIYWDDAPVTAYTISRFAAVHWASDGVYLDTIVSVGAVADVHSIRIAAGSDVRGTAVACNGKFLLVAWKGSLLGNPTASVEGLRFPVRNNGIVLAEADTFTFSNPSEPIVTSVPDLSLAMDTVGSIAAIWPRPEMGVGACAWANRPVRHETGFWISAVDSVPMNVGDSVVFKPGTTVKHGSGSTRQYIRVGPKPGDYTAWSTWALLGAQVELSTHTLGTSRYFQLKSEFVRGTDSLKTPVVTDIRAVWNVKPRFMQLTDVRVNAESVPGTGINDTLSILSRSDTVAFSFLCHDPDTGDILYADVTSLISETVKMRDTVTFGATVSLGAMPVSDTLYRSGISIRDTDGWRDGPRYLFFQTTNSVPELDCRVVWDSTGDGKPDTISIPGATMNIFLPPVDSVVVLYSVEDRNDADISVGAAMNDGAATEVSRGEVGRLVLADQIFSGGTDSVRIRSGDPDTTVSKTIYFRRNDPPRITGLKLNSLSVESGDTVRILPGRKNTIAISAVDRNEAYWDTLSYRIISGDMDTVIDDGSLECTFGRADETVSVIVHDIAHEADTLRFALVHRWLDLDSTENSALGRTRDTLRNHLSVVVGSRKRDTVIIPYRNSGTDTARIVNINFTGSTDNWLLVGVENTETGNLTFYNETELQGAVPNIIPPGKTAWLAVALDPTSLSGDGIASDTIRIETDDPLHASDSFTVNYEHNELPVLVDVTFSYQPRTPYWLTKSRAPEGYRFPPHAAVRIAFSEPIDSASAAAGIRMYSALDSAAAGEKRQIPLSYRWENAYTTVAVRPVYEEPSPFFGGILPPPGMFISTDSLILVLGSQILDQATTPHGPNGLDVDMDAVRDMDADTSMGLRVDSAQFSLIKVTPTLFDTTGTTKPTISLEFSSLILPGTIDTAKMENKSLTVTTSFYSGDNPKRVIPFDTVYTNKNTAIFVPAKRFFYGDRVLCRYRGHAARDTLGYPIDNNKDGIPIGFLDSASREDDIEWSFRIYDISHAERYPGDQAEGVPRNLTIRLQYDDPVLPAVLDSSLVGNRTITVTSRDSRGDPLDFDSVSIDSTSALFRVSRRLNYGDSVHCIYNGLSTRDTGEFFYQSDRISTLRNNDGYEWNFDITSLELVSVSPESATVISQIDAPITMTFSGPVSADLFHLLLDEKNNRSFALRSRFGKGENLPIGEISLSEDRRTVKILPVRKFFGNDSVHCIFRGFPLGKSYVDTMDPFSQKNLRLSGGYEWHFLTSGVEFYTYPNPFRSSDRRHFSKDCCGGNPDRYGRCREVPCGIVFKNLHALRKGINDIRVRIFNMNTHLVFDSESARRSDNPGLPIHFSEADTTSVPEWTWYTKNTDGDLVASGIYFYIISDKKDGKNLLKGKLIIVR